MILVDNRRRLKIGHRSRHLKYAVIGLAERPRRLKATSSIFLARSVIWQASGSTSGVMEALQEKGSPLKRFCRIFLASLTRSLIALEGVGLAAVGQLVELHGRNLDMYVYTVEQRSAHPPEVFRHRFCRTGAFLFRVAEIAAGAGIHGRRQALSPAGVGHRGRPEREITASSTPARG